MPRRLRQRIWLLLAVLILLVLILWVYVYFHAELEHIEQDIRELEKHASNHFL